MSKVSIDYESLDQLMRLAMVHTPMTDETFALCKHVADILCDHNKAEFRKATTELRAVLYAMFRASGSMKEFLESARLLAPQYGAIRIMLELELYERQRKGQANLN